MPLSSNTLIHFTSSKEALKGILSDNFKLKYCKETVSWEKGQYSELYIPMVSFCDIPLSQIKDHIANYGHYGIGLKKEWALKNRLNPVFYVQSNSNLAKTYVKYVDDILKYAHKFEDDLEAYDRALDTFRYIKNYEADLVRNGKKIKKYRFSDEREWRYVPALSEKCEMFCTTEDYVPKSANDSLKDIRLKFEPNDVKYIIIKNDEEIGEFVDHLRKAKGNKYTHNDIERLTTRLFTSDQIHEDI